MPEAGSSAARAVRPARSVAIGTLASRVLGLARDKVTVFVLAQPVADALFLAWTIPNLFRRLFGEGALSAALVPVLAQAERSAGKAGRERAARSVIWALIALLAPLTALLIAAILLLPQRWLLAPFESERTGARTLELLAITLPYVVLICVAAQLQSVANMAGRFFVPALAPALSNVTWIAGAALAATVARAATGGEPDARFIAVAILAGGVLQVLLQWLELRRAGERVLAPAPILTPESREVARRMAPMFLGLAASQVNLVADRFIAESMVAGEGAVTQLYLGNRLMQLPLGLIGVALGTAVFPELARAAAQLDWAGHRAALRAALRVAFTLCAPAIVGLVVLAAPIMGLLFEGGRFDAAGVESSAACLAAYAPTLLLQTVVTLLARADYSRGDTRRPAVASAIAMGVNVALDLALAIPFGATGIAAATTAAALVNVLLLAQGRRDEGRTTGSELLRPALRVAAVALVMGAAVLLVRASIESLDLPRWDEILGASLPLRHGAVAVGGIACGLAVYLAGARRLARAELDELLALLRARRVGPGGPSPVR